MSVVLLNVIWDNAKPVPKISTGRRKTSIFTHLTFKAISPVYICLFIFIIRKDSKRFERISGYIHL